MVKNLILGNGQVGKALMKTIPNSINLTRKELNFSDTDIFTLQLKAILDSHNISAIINATAYTDVDKAESERDLALNVNANCPKILAEHCNRHNIPLIHYSTDFVFDGNKKDAYIEQDAASPINYYGLSKQTGDDAILSRHNKAIILRVSWVYSIFTKNNFVMKILNAAQTLPELKVIDDQLGAPCNAVDIARSTLNILLSIPSWARIMGQKKRDIATLETDIWGLYNLAPHNFTNRYIFANEILELAELYTQYNIVANVKSAKTDNSKALAKRPLNSMLNSNKIFDVFDIKMPDWDDSLKNAFIHYFKN